LAGVLLAPGIAIPQASKKVRRIGVLEPVLVSEAFQKERADALRDLGWVEGQNLQIERRYFAEASKTPEALAEELVRAKVELILTNGTRATLAAKRATTTIPIVFGAAGDPVALGLVASLARPGGNVTGYSLATPEVTAKRLSVLKELLPQLQRVGMLQVARDPFYQATRTQLEQVFRSLGLVPIIVEIEAGQMGGSIEQLARQNVQALILNASVVGDHAAEFVDAATKRGLPTMAEDNLFVREAGALLSYGTTLAEAFRRSAEYIDRILRGAKPADLPVQQPTKFELVINLRTAKALGLTIPKELLLRADEVIQ
jgi:putative ABC transport system substrate-binding protein